MEAVLYLGSIVAFLAGFAFFGAAKSAIHEIEGAVFFLISAVLFAGATNLGGHRRLLTALRDGAKVPHLATIVPPSEEGTERRTGWEGKTL